jgi:acetyl esterase/lipase
MKPFLFLFLWATIFSNGQSQKIIPLYKGDIPNSIPSNIKEVPLYWDGTIGAYKNISHPTLTVFLPDKNTATGCAVVICPGGGYSKESYKEEGEIIAYSFIKHGIAAFILKYRLPSDSIMNNKSIGPLQDAQMALKVLRENSDDWNINKKNVGMMGFSAGGHLVSLAGTHFDSCFIPNEEHTNVRPDFMILVYPLISMSDKLTHHSSRRNLLGLNPSAESVDFFSSELYVTDKTPPVYLTHTEDDQVVDVDNCILFYEALKNHKVPTEMHLYPAGGHEFIQNLPVEDWMKPVYEWLNNSKMIKK